MLRDYRLWIDFPAGTLTIEKTGWRSTVLRIVADLGNSRLKWGRIGEDGRLEETAALPLDDSSAWDAAWRRWNHGGSRASAWAIATVNPPLAERLGAFLTEHGVSSMTWYRSAAEVPIRHALEQPETTGADRALAVAGAWALQPPGIPGLVAACGTAITVERIAADGTWQGGAIASGLTVAARALHLLTAQLPLVRPGADPPPPPWGRSTRPALEAGVFWGTVGTTRELLARQAAGLEPKPWLVWTGGDAESLAPWIEWHDARIVPDLVLEGLARIAFL
jgi:type III pantothenate kinase